MRLSSSGQLDHLRLPTVDVIVAVRNDPRLVTCLSALEGQTYPRDLVTIVVVNNGALDTLPQGIEGDPRYLVLHEVVPGAAAARNTGIARTRGDVIAITDADCIPTPGWLEAGVRALEAGDAFVAGGIEMFFARTPPTPVEYADASFHLRQARYARRGYAATASAFFWRHVLESSGGFDPAVLAVEDMDLGLRISKGRPIRHVPQALVKHPAIPGLRALLRKRLLQARHVHRVVPWTWKKVLTRLGPRSWRTCRTCLTDPTLPRLRARLAHLAIIQLLSSAGALAGARELLRHPSQEPAVRRPHRDHLHSVVES